MCHRLCPITGNKLLFLNDLAQLETNRKVLWTSLSKRIRGFCTMQGCENGQCFDTLLLQDVSEQRMQVSEARLKMTMQCFVCDYCYFISKVSAKSQNLRYITGSAMVGGKGRGHGDVSLAKYRTRCLSMTLTACMCLWSSPMMTNLLRAIITRIHRPLMREAFSPRAISVSRLERFRRCCNPSNVTPEQSGNTQTHVQTGSVTTAGYRHAAHSCGMFRDKTSRPEHPTSQISMKIRVPIG